MKDRLPGIASRNPAIYSSRDEMVVLGGARQRE
jgi:hypothetical protein